MTKYDEHTITVMSNCINQVGKRNCSLIEALMSLNVFLPSDAFLINFVVNKDCDNGTYS